MRLISAPSIEALNSVEDSDLQVVLYDRVSRGRLGSAGAAIKQTIVHENLNPSLRAWDLLSVALSVIASDLSALRKESPDGWTRQLELTIAVNDPDFWSSQSDLLQNLLSFLTTDLWHITFIEGKFILEQSGAPRLPTEDCVSLLSGGLDSLIGAIDLVTRDGKQPYLVSHIAQGDKRTQKEFAAQIGGGLHHLQLNHNTQFPNENERSQRARSIAFLAYGVLAATALKNYHDGEVVPLYICENGFISINPPLTDGRIGSLSTRTTHPIFLKQFQELLEAAGIRVHIENPYQFRTKGEMLIECTDQAFLYVNAHIATSCGRYARNAYRHCGRCIPCLVRRAAIQAWGQPDRTTYVYPNLAIDDENHARFDDVRSIAMATAEINVDGFGSWFATKLNSSHLGDITQYQQTVERGMRELEDLFISLRIT